MNADDNKLKIQEDNTEKKKSVISETIILAICPALAYFIVFTYEVAYCSVFAIPKDFIHPDITTVLIVCALFWSFLIFPLLPLINILIVLIDPLFDFLVKHRHKISTSPKLLVAIMCFVAISLFVIGWILFPAIWIMWLMLSVFAGLYLLSFVLQGIINRKTDRTLGQKVVEALDYEAETNILTILGNKYGSNIMLYVALFVAVYVFALLKGLNDAKKTDTFLVPTSCTNVVALKIYGNDAICAQYNPTNNTVKPIFFMMNLHGEPPPILEVKKIGVLTSRNNIPLKQGK